jgi:hypothetical protein
MEYFVNNDLLANLERLCEKDRPHGIKCMSPYSRSSYHTLESIELMRSGSVEGIEQLNSPPTR